MKNSTFALIVIICALILMLAVTAAVMAEDNNLSVVAPTENTDGTVLADLSGINFYHRVNAGDWSLLDTVSANPGETVSYLDANRLDGEHCYYATAVTTSGQESAPSNEACKTVDAFPGIPTGLTVE